PLAGRRGGAPARGQAAHGAVARPRPRRRRVPPGRRQGDPRQPGLRRAPAQPRRLRPHVPPLHRLRRARALLARAPPRRVGPPVRPEAGRRLHAVPRARRRRRGRGAARRRGGRGGAARGPPPRLALLHHAVRVRQGVRRVGAAVVVRRGGGAAGDGARRVRAPGEGELVRLLPGAGRRRPAGHRGPVRRAHAAGEPLRARHHPGAPRQGDDRRRRRRGAARLRRYIAFPAGQRGARRRRHRRSALDAMAVLMEWAMARLVLHRDVQAKVHRELDEVVGRSSPVAEPSLPALPYLQALIKEALRVHPPGPLLSWRHRAITDTYVDGHLVPAGTTAMVNQWAMSRDPEVWDAPLEFRPERFLAGGEAPDVSVLGADG
uniref:Cytochrome P450 n=1 Tax=Aegilops tauschii subsp. strangulata TaxID=200361 RepID=A0A453J389_AEGTS